MPLVKFIKMHVRSLSDKKFPKFLIKFLHDVFRDKLNTKLVIKKNNFSKKILSA